MPWPWADKIGGKGGVKTASPCNIVVTGLASGLFASLHNLSPYYDNEEMMEAPAERLKCQSGIGLMPGARKRAQKTRSNAQ